MFLFQVYPRHSAQYLPLLLPLLLEAVSLTGPSAEDVMPALLSPYYSDFRIAQVLATRVLGVPSAWPALAAICLARIYAVAY